MRVSPKLKAVYGYRFKDGSGKEVSKTLGEVRNDKNPDGWTLDAALTEFQNIRAKSRNKGPRLILSEALADWLANSPSRRNDGTRSPRTVEYYQEAYDRYLVAHADVNLADANADYWMKVLRPARERAPHQARGAYWLLHGIYSYNVELKVLTDNPLASSLMRRTFSGKNLKVRRKTSLSMSHAPAFFAGVMQLPRHSRDAVLTVALTGWRHVGVLAMRWDQLDLVNGSYEVKAQDLGWKGFEGTIAISDSVLDILKERRALLPGEAYVFPARHGKSQHMTDIGGGIESACADMPAKVTANDLRRSWITAAEAALGGNALLIARLLGHADGSTEFTEVQAGYLVGDLQAQRYSAQLVADALLETGGVYPLSTEVADLFKQRGVQLAPGLTVL